MSSRDEVVLDPVLEDGEPLLLQAAASIVREALVSQVQEGWSPPQCQRFLAAAFLRQLFELLHVELALLDTQDVARISRQQPAVAELLA
jgi:hypothetical protein